MKDETDSDFDALLDDFINQQLAEIDEQQAIIEDDIRNAKKTPPQNKKEEEDDDDDELLSGYEGASDDSNVSQYAATPDEVAALAEEERRLYNSYSEFVESVGKCAKNRELEMPDLEFSPADITPRFSPRRTDNLKGDILACWDILIKSEKDYLVQLPYNPTDEQILNFAEKISAPNLQLSLISYVETLIEIESCENAYNIRRVKFQKHQIEKRLYEEQQRIIAQKRAYVAAIKAKNFPIDADLLVNNFFKASNKDPENAAKILRSNPAMFAPIQVDKIPNRFFGLIKAKPSDGIIINKKIGKFLADLKV